MNERICSRCGAILTEATQDCPRCSASLPLEEEVAEQISLDKHLLNTARPTYLAPQVSFLPRSLTPRFPRFFTVSSRKHKGNTPASLLSNPRPELFTSPLTDESQSGEFDEGKVEPLPQRQATWYKIVDTPAYQNPATYPPRPPLPQQPPPMLHSQSFLKRYISPVALFCISCSVLLLLIGGSIFGIASTLGHAAFHLSTNESSLSLQVTPHIIAIGAIVTLHGNHFTAGGYIGITRDHSIPVIDTGGTAIVTASKQGAFTDTVSVEPSWGNGPHSISAEDAATHKLISFPILVTGNGAALRPSHLLSSTSMLDLGSGDQATNTTKSVTLTNSGDEQIVWHADTSQPWLVMSPESGSIPSSSSMQVAIAIARMGMSPGTYTGQVVFSTNVGDMVLPVHVDVTQLQPGHDAVLQLTPAILSFNATDGGNAPAAHEVVVTNPGLVPLSWQVTSNVSWLSFSQLSGTVKSSDSNSVTVGVNTRNMLPGTYNGIVVFHGQGANVLHPTQSIYVSVTVAPGCSLMITPNILNFSAVYNQPDPAVQTINLAHSASCTVPPRWSAKSNSSWLSINSTYGTTPQSASIGIRAVGLQPGVYTGSITFTSSQGIDILGVNFTLAKPGAPLMSSSTGSLTFNAVTGQGGSTQGQTFVLTDTGGGDLRWQVGVTTGSGGNWLSVSPGSGNLAAHQSVTLSVNTLLLSGLNPGTYTGSINITGTDNSGRTAPGSPQMLFVSLIITPPCTLQSASTTIENFSSEVGTNPGARTFSIGVSGNCSGSVTIIPGVTLTNGTGWLAVTPASATVAAGSSVTFSVQVNSTNLPVGAFTGIVVLNASANSIPLVGSPQAVAVRLNMVAAATLLAVPTSLTFNVTTGVSSQTLALSNTGGVAFNWTAVLASGAPSFVSLSATSGSNLVSGASSSLSVTVDATGVASGTINTSIMLSASDVLTGNAASGSPMTIPVTINVAPPSMQLSSAVLNFSTIVASDPAPQTIVLTNTGGGTLAWTAGTPTQSWLTISPMSGSTPSGGTASLTFSVSATGLAASAIAYAAQVTITPSVGTAVSVTVSMTVNDITPTATASLTVTPTTVIPTVTLTVTPPVATPTSSPSALLVLDITGVNNKSQRR